MAEHTTIEWAEATWNPTTGCDRVSPGCDRCYALTLAGRLKRMGQPRYQLDGDPRTSGPGFGVAMHRDVLRVPQYWRKPRRVFVNSMSDLFHARVPATFVARVWFNMHIAGAHQFLILTKRPQRMRGWLEGCGPWESWMSHNGGPIQAKGGDGLVVGTPEHWPLPNVWLGASVEDQQRADERIPQLLATPAAVRWISAEPLLGPVDLSPYLLDAPGLDWVVAGGESGPGYRPLHLDWVRDLRDQCRSAEVPFFFKQVGGRTPKAGGRLLDGRTWDEFPAGVR